MDAIDLGRSRPATQWYKFGSWNIFIIFDFVWLSRTTVLVSNEIALVHQN